MTGKLRDLVDALDVELRAVSRNPYADGDLCSMEMQLRIWLDDVCAVRFARTRRAGGRCTCGRKLELDGSCRTGCAP